MITHAPSCKCAFCGPIYEALSDLDAIKNKLEKTRPHGNRTENAYVGEAMRQIRVTIKTLEEAIDRV